MIPRLRYTSEGSPEMMNYASWLTLSVSGCSFCKTDCGGKIFVMLKINHHHNTKKKSEREREREREREISHLVLTNKSDLMKGSSCKTINMTWCNILWQIERFKSCMPVLFQVSVMKKDFRYNGLKSSTRIIEVEQLFAIVLVEPRFPGAVSAFPRRAGWHFKGWDKEGK